MKTLQERFNLQIAIIDKALADIAAGKIVNLGKMDDEVAALCREVESAGSETAHAMKAVLGTMITKLDELGERLTEFQARMQGK